MIKRLRNDEQGTTLVILVLSLVVLLGFAGIAIDGAAAWAERRQAQSAADTGAIAGAILATGKAKDVAIADATAEVVRITYNTLDPDVTQAQWDAAWVACTDSTKPAKFTETGTSDCVSFTANLDTIRVVTPDTPWETTFAKVIGFDEVHVNAVAEVETSITANGGVLPFAMPGAAGGLGEVCLKTGSNPKNVAPCDGPDSGNFGFLDFTQFGDGGSNPPICQGGNSRLENNIANGIDHILGVAPSFPPTSNSDRDACNAGDFNARPWHVDTQTGNVAQALDDGLVDVTGTGTPGRLTNSSTTINVRGHQLDNKPLWMYFNAAGTNVCGAINDHDAMLNCLQNVFDPATDPPLFVDEIAESPRFGWVPLLYENSLGPGNSEVTFREFRPVFIQTTLWGCNASNCSLEWDPGEGSPTPGPNNKKVEAASALQIPLNALPDWLRAGATGNMGEVNYLISR